MEKESKIFVAGHLGLSGSALLNTLKAEGYTNTVTKTKKELDLKEIFI
jgi:GDP-L-fucose synthase